MRKLFLCELAMTSLSSSPALPHHSMSAEDKKMSCPHPVLLWWVPPFCAWDQTPPAGWYSVVWLHPSHCFQFTEPVLCVNIGFYFQHILRMDSYWRVKRYLLNWQKMYWTIFPQNYWFYLLEKGWKFLPSTEMHWKLWLIGSLKCLQTWINWLLLQKCLNGLSQQRFEGLS